MIIHEVAERQNSSRKFSEDFFVNDESPKKKIEERQPNPLPI